MKTTVISAKRGITDPEWLAQMEAEGKAVYIGRRSNQSNPKRKEDSKWKNPAKVDKPGKKRDGTREECVEKYRKHLLDNPNLLAQIEELRGKYLICWCAPEACHGDVLVELLGETDEDQ